MPDCGQVFDINYFFGGVQIPMYISTSKLSDSEKLMMGFLLQCADEDGMTRMTDERLCATLGWESGEMDKVTTRLIRRKLIAVNNTDPQHKMYVFLKHPIYDKLTSL